MKTFIWALIAILIVGGIGWAVFKGTPATTGNGNATSTPVETATTTDTTTTTTGGTGAVSGGSSSMETYANATYGFRISYPKDLNAESYGNFHAFNQNDWRYGASMAHRGTPVISIPVIRIDNQAKGVKTYPLFYDAEVRVGVSSDVANCYVMNEGYTNQTITNVTINGVTWKKFIFGDAAMQQYVNGASYRTVHNNMCYVIEQLENGSHYTDETIKGGYTDADLKAFYNKTTPIVMSFKFTK